MKFSQTESAKEYGLTFNDVDFDIAGIGSDSPTVLIVPHNDEFPIEAIEVESEEDAYKLVALLREEKYWLPIIKEFGDYKNAINRGN